MKITKAAAVMLALLTVLALAGCGAGAKADPAADISAQAAEVTAAVEEEPKEELPEPEPEINMISLFGESIPETSEEISVTAPEVDPFVLADAIKELPELKKVDLRASGILQDDALALSRHFTEIEFVWNNTVFGLTLPSDSVEVDLSGIMMDGTDEAEEMVKYFPKVEKVVMCDCGIPDEEMDALNKRHENIKFVWMVHFSIYSLRTDVTYFCAADVPGYVAPELFAYEMQPLKYCTDIEALDIGHMYYDNLEFISGMTKMKYLVAVQGKFHDISPIANMPDLEYLELFTNNRIVDITPLLECKNLKHLNLGYCYYLDWEPLKEMTQLERLWLPHVGLTDEEKAELTAALPNTLIHMPLTDPMGSTGAGWREDQSYFDMRDAMHMFYLPGGTGMDVD